MIVYLLFLFLVVYLIVHSVLSFYSEDRLDKKIDFLGENFRVNIAKELSDCKIVAEAIERLHKRLETLEVIINKPKRKYKTRRKTINVKRIESTVPKNIDVYTNKKEVKS